MTAPFTARERPISDRARLARRAGLVLTAAAGAIAAVVAVRTAIRVFLSALRGGRRAARFAYRAATFRLYRRCPDCKRLMRSDARVCQHCGHRRATADQTATPERTATRA